MKEFRFLKILDKFKGIYTRLGVDYEKMRMILSIKLTLDMRRSLTITANSRKSDDNDNKNSFFMSLILYGIMGAFIGAMILMDFNRMYSFSIAFGMFMFFILTIFISDFSSVLLDVRDKNIIGTKGIDNKTINAAKITHICYYIFLISLSLSWLSIVGMFKISVFIGLLFILELIVADILMIVVTALLYLLILRFFDGEKVKDIINFVQVFLTITMTVGYQFLGRMFDMADSEVIYESSIWNLFLPPMWFAAPLYAVNGGPVNKIIVTLIILSFVVPVIAIVLYLKNTSKFENSLSKLNTVNNSEKEKSKGLLYKIGRYLCKSNEEKAFYDLSFSVMKREREFKLKAYPNFGFLVIFPVLFIFIFSRHDFTSLSNISLYNCLNIYWFIFSIPSVMVIMENSSNYKAAWIYDAVFIEDKADIYKGTYKALIINILMPLYLIDSIAFSIIFGIKVVPILINTFLFLLIYIAVMHSMLKIKIPFSIKAGVSDNGRQLAASISGLLIMGISAAISYAVLANIFLVIIYGLILMILVFITWKKCIVIK